MKDEQFGMPVIGIVNSFTQFVPGHTHLHEIGQYVKTLIEERGCFAAEFNTIAIDDGIAMGHDGMLYSLPSREIIADSVEYMANAHQVDALFCISNCDKITPGMLMAAMRLNIPTIFVSGGPMEAGNFDGKGIDLIDAMVMSADSRCSDADIEKIERWACPGCGSCSGMFTANSMNCLNEALGLALPGNGTIVATHTNRRRLFEKAASLIVQMDGNGRWAKKRGLPRSAGHKAGAEVFRTISKACGRIGIPYVTFYAFSTENWKRSPEEVDALMRLFKDYLLEAQADISQAGNIRLKFIGSREGISDELLQLMDQGERDTAANTGTTVYVAINYGGRQEIVQAVNRALQNGKREITIDDISANVYTVPDCDLVIRPSGEQRLSNFLLWQAAYSEFWYSDVLWPDFTEQDLAEALHAYENRNRRFGGR